MVDGPISRWRLLIMDLIILGLQLTMLAVTASTAPPEPATVRASGSEELDRAERGESDESTAREEEGEDPEGAEMERNDELVRETKAENGYEPIVINVGVVETIKLLWGSEVPIVRRFR
jgi:hypothetical protein